MTDLFETRMQMIPNAGVKIKNRSDLLLNKNFVHDVAQRRAVLYDWDSNKLDEVDIRFQYSQSYTINKDQVEYLVQFRPGYHPEQIYVRPDGVQQMGFFLDIPDDVGNINRWIIMGRNDVTQFVRYNVLKCNWVFKYIVDGTLYEQIGVLRDRNNYNSGVWSDGFVTSVENQAQFIVPTNAQTCLIDYDMRFMLSDNKVHPLVYQVSKRTDTFPVGIQKITLSQHHFDPHCDNVELGVCDYYSPITEHPDISDTPKVQEISISYTGTKPYLYIGGSSRVVTGTIYNTEGQEIVLDNYEWTFKLDNVDCSQEQLEDYFSLTINKNKIEISAKKDYGNVGKILTFILSYNDQQSQLNMEVVAS